MDGIDYLMESEDENLRLDLKTDPVAVSQQAAWAEIGQNMRVADLGCGSGKTTSVLHRLIQPGGTVVGVDISESRVDYARQHYQTDGIEFVCRDMRVHLDDLGQFDVVWIRFVLEYYRSNAVDILRNASRILNPGGTLCVIDLDLNCLNHFGLSQRLERTIMGCVRTLEEKVNFDPYVGRKLYSYLYDLGYEAIAVSVGSHHVIYGDLRDVDAFNWAQKIEVLASKVDFDFTEYSDGFKGFSEDFRRFFSDPRRFSYTPIVSVRGRKPT